MRPKQNSNGKKSSKHQSFRQANLFAVDAPSVKLPHECNIVSVGKRRDGGTRYRCLQHKADATAKYGKPAQKCRASHIPLIRLEDTLALEIDKFNGGVAMWGAVPAVYDTTRLPMDRGIHVHTRRAPGDKKETDYTYPAVRVFSERLIKEGIFVSEIDAIYYMVSSIFGYETKHILCTYCGYAHLDKDWFSVHPHRRHLCAGCGKHFRDNEIAIGNPIFALKDALKVKPLRPRVSDKKLSIEQADFSGGIQIWGSNPAFLWTSELPEDEGIHVHAYHEGEEHPNVDETYGEVIIDGVKLNPSMVRTLMAQSALPSIANRVLSVHCPSCHKSQFSEGESAFTPATVFNCKKCGHQFGPRGRLRKIIANPLVEILAKLADKAPRTPQKFDLGLMPETL